MRRLPAAALVWGALAVPAAVAACAAAPPKPAASSQPPPGSSEGRWPTISVSYLYQGGLILQILRDGEPFDGDVMLRVFGRLTEIGPLDGVLRVERGRVVVPHEVVDELARSPEVWLSIEGHSLPLPRSAGLDPFACAQSLRALLLMDACMEPLPTGSVVPDGCESAGQRAWLEALQGKEEQARVCWSKLDAPTLERLARAQKLPVRPAACALLLAAQGDDMPDESALKIVPICLDAFPEPRREGLRREHLRLDLPAAFEQAKAGDSEKMREFFTSYRTIDRARADEIRALALRRFGPTDPTRWLALRDAIEALPGGPFRATLCDYDSTSAQVAVGRGAPQRYSGSGRPLSGAALGIALAPPLRFDGVSPTFLREEKERKKLIERAAALVKARLGVQSVDAPVYCSRGKHWYLAEPLPKR